MIKQDNKLIFDINKKYVAGRSTVLNNVNRKQFLLNKNIVVYAYIKEIEFNTDDIKVKLNSTDDTETIITLDKTVTDNSGIPEYTTPDAKTDELNYALTLFVNEAYKDFKAGTNINPPAVDVSEYETRIQELTSELEQARETITELTPADTTVSASPLLDLDLTGAYLGNGTSTALFIDNDKLSSVYFKCYIPVTTDDFNDSNRAFTWLAKANIEFTGAKLNNTDITNTLYTTDSWSYTNNPDIIYYQFDTNIGTLNIPVGEEDYTVELTIKNKQTNKTITITAEIDHTTMKFKQNTTNEG